MFEVLDKSMTKVVMQVGRLMEAKSEKDDPPGNSKE